MITFSERIYPLEEEENFMKKSINSAGVDIYRVGMAYQVNQKRKRRERDLLLHSINKSS